MIFSACLEMMDDDAIGVELNPTSATMSESRIVGDAPLFAQVTVS